jgi:hypothetical protein
VVATAAPQQPGKLTAVEIRRGDETRAMGVGKRFAADPNRGAVRKMNMGVPSSDIRARVTIGHLEMFAPGWAIIGDKPGGVEGGFIVRRVFRGPNMADFIKTDEGFAQLQTMSQTGGLFLPDELKNLKGNALLEAFSKLAPSQQNEVATTVMDLTPSYQKSYMVKVVFGENDVERGGSVFCKPNPKGVLHRMFTKRSAKDINKEVLQEYAALQVAGAISPELAPEALLGKVETTGHDPRFFLMTEMAGSGDSSASFQTLGDVDVTRGRVDERFAGLSYALTVGLLGDRDANKNGNVGLLRRGKETPKPFLFDLGHPDPTRYKLNPTTFLPERTSEGSTGFYLGKLNKSDVLSDASRRENLRELLNNRRAVERAMEEAIALLPPNSQEAAVLRNMDDEFRQRMDYLEGLLRSTEPQASTINPERRQRDDGERLARHRAHTKPASK